MQQGKCQKLHTGFFPLQQKRLPYEGKPWMCESPKPPLSGRWLGEAETERSQQICDNLSVSLRLTAPLKGEPFRRSGVTPQALRASSLTREPRVRAKQ